MTSPIPYPAAPDEHDIGARLKGFRTALGLSLAKLAEMTGISNATLSRVENGQVLVSAHNLYALSQALGVDITAFYADAPSPLRAGIRSVSRKGEGQEVTTDRFLSRVFASDLANKKMHPAVNTITAFSLAEAGGLASHAGEEFIYVLKGQLVLHSEHYAPLLLAAGDTLYFDAAMPHAYVAMQGGPADILVVNTTDRTET